MGEVAGKDQTNYKSINSIAMKKVFFPLVVLFMTTVSYSQTDSLKINPDWIAIIDGKCYTNEIHLNDDRNPYDFMDKVILRGTWYGELTRYSRNTSRGTVDWITPRTGEQNIILILLNNDGLAAGLQKNKAYSWKGGRNFTFIQNVDVNLDIEKTLKQLGMKKHGHGVEKNIML